MLLTVMHATTYRYADPVHRSTQYIRMTPSGTARQRVLRWELTMPGSAVVMTDAFDNVTHVQTLDEPHERIDLVARGQVEVDEVDDGEPVGRLDPRVFLRSTPLTAPDDAIRALVEPLRALARARPRMALGDLVDALLERMPYERGVTSVTSTAAQALAGGKGVCQDHAQVFVAASRLLGVPARYVSGYLHSDGGDSSHAWAEAWIGQRWQVFDVSNARHPLGALVKLAVGIDYLDACPVRGVRLGGGEERLEALAEVRATQ